MRSPYLFLKIVIASSTVLMGHLTEAAPSATEQYDVVVYSGTSGGVAAAVQARRMGKTALIIEPGKHLGGLTSGGLGATDIGNKAAIGGISREYYQRVRKHYDEPTAWKHEQQDKYRSKKSTDVSKEDAMWTFEPHVAEKIMNDFVREAGVTVVFGERLDLKKGVEKEGANIVAIRMESGKTYRGKRFIDASYEGDLLALAGVSFHVGRESNATYNETLNGVQTQRAKYHQMHPGVDPYIKKGDKSSGLLPGVHAGPPGEEGSGDKRVQAYNFRICVTDVAENRVPFEKPEGYNPLRYELLLRNFEAGETRAPWAPSMMPNRKTDANNNYGFASDNIGMNYDWPEGDYAARDKMFQDHLLYHRGLMWTLANNPRVPDKIRNEIARWGNTKDEFKDNAGWPHQLYVREARRMISDYVMSQSNCQGRASVEDSVGLAAYTMDSHHVQRYVDENGHARNEGDVQVGGFPPYSIAYRSIVPKEAQCANLLVPVCLSASHIAYGSIRMEPVFMVLGQSAATAACFSIDANVAVQRVDITKLKEKLLEDKQVLEWKGGGRTASSLDPAKLMGVVLDDASAKREGEWLASSVIGPFVGPQYLHDNNEGKGQKTIRFVGTLKQAGRYEVRFAYTPNGNRATNIPVTVHHAEGEKTILVNERKSPSIDGLFISLGEFRFDASTEQPLVVVSNEKTDGHVVVDAVLLVPVNGK